MLTREQILATIDAHADQLRRLGARSLALLGSVAGDTSLRPDAVA